jgi:hypothetical protein
MSLFSWFLPTKKKKAAKSAPPQSSGLSRMEPTRPVNRRAAAPEAAPGQPANRKGERMARRELLYGVVREAMVRAGVLSSSYKFKVLSLDGRGRQFLLMVDLAREHGGETSRLAEIEALIAQSAKSRFDILVTAVYWRTNEHVAVGLPGTRATPSRPMPLDSQPAALDSVPPVAAEKPVARFDPIEADEVAAFKRALAAGLARAAPSSARSFDGAGVHGPQSYTLLTGYEDTEMPDEPRAPALSGTQYGDLR